MKLIIYVLRHIHSTQWAHNPWMSKMSKVHFRSIRSAISLKSPCEDTQPPCEDTQPIAAHQFGWICPCDVCDVCDVCLWNQNLRSVQVDQVTHSDCETSVVQQYIMLNRAKIAGANAILCQNRHRPLQAGHQVVSSSPVPLPPVSWLRIKGHLMVGQARQCAFLELLVLAWDMGCASLFLCEQSSWHDQFPRLRCSTGRHPWASYLKWPLLPMIGSWVTAAKDRFARISWLIPSNRNQHLEWSSDA